MPPKAESGTGRAGPGGAGWALGSRLAGDAAAGRGPGRSLVFGTSLAPTPLRVLVGRLASAVIAVSGGWYLWWRRLTLSGTGPFGAAFLVAEVGTYLFLLVTAALLLRTRRRLDGPPAPPAGTLDVFVTVCGEPVEMVERTLRAALAISYPHQTYLLNDGRVAGKAGWREVEELASALGVTCFTREGGSLGKAANLNHALRLTRGEFVATIDADHVARAELAHDTLGYFADEGVAFVATLQRFETEGPDILNNAEPIFYHGLQPAKDADGCAFSCGNGVVYRRSALDAVGGFSEWGLVEDLHTSYRLHAAGWTSVYHPWPVTVGTAPSTAAVYLKQRLRWAMDSLRLLLFDSPLRRPGLSWRLRLHYLHTTSVYPFASLQVMFVLGPPLYIVRRTWVMNPPSETSYLIHAMPYLVAVIIFLIVHCGYSGAIRTMQGALFAGPVYLLALARTLLGLLPSTDPTEKARQPSFSLLMAPPIAAVAVLIGALGFALVAPGGRGSTISLMWDGLQAYLLLGPLSAISEAPRTATAFRTTARAALVAIVASVLFVVHLR